MALKVTTKHHVRDVTNVSGKPREKPTTFKENPLPPKLHADAKSTSVRGPTTRRGGCNR
jgi:hypothetical protein